MFNDQVYLFAIIQMQIPFQKIQKVKKRHFHSEDAPN